MKVRFREGTDKTPLYKPGLPVDQVARELGIDPDTIVKLASNENPLGPSPKAVEAMKEALNDLHRYPDGGAWKLTQKLSEKFAFGAENFIVGNGSNEILELIAQVFLEPGTNAVMGEYPFVVYPLVTQHFGAEIRKVPMPNLRYELQSMLSAVDKYTRVIFIASPNNPTPYHVTNDEFESFIQKLPNHVLLVFDEAYVEYVEEPIELLNWVRSKENVIGLRTFSKIYGIAGSRIGYGYGNPDVIALLKRARQPFSVNSIALAGAVAAIDDEDFVRQSREVNREGTEQLVSGLGRLGIKVSAGEANFILIEVPEPDRCCEELLGKGVIVRSMSPFSLDGMVRVSVGSQAENERFLEALEGLEQRHL